MNEPPPLPHRPTVSPQAAAAPRVLASVELFGPENEVHILHEGQLYRLRITRQGKLILTK